MGYSTKINKFKQQRLISKTHKMFSYCVIFHLAYWIYVLLKLQFTFLSTEESNEQMSQDFL